MNIVAISLCAIICRADNWVAIEQFVKSKEDWFASFLDLPNGIPSNYTISHFFAALDHRHFNELFSSWSESISHKIKKQICVDGKTMRGTKSTSQGLKGLHIVNAWCTENKLCLGQIDVDSKSNEITAIPELLDLLDIKDTVISIDAMGCQKDIAKKIKDKQADYVLALKKNQNYLYEDIELYFRGFNDRNGDKIETRKCYKTNKIDWLEHNGWSNLDQIDS